jgi:hypothetical protein
MGLILLRTQVHTHTCTRTQLNFHLINTIQLETVINIARTKWYGFKFQAPSHSCVAQSCVPAPDYLDGNDLPPHSVISRMKGKGSR